MKNQKVPTSFLGSPLVLILLLLCASPIGAQEVENEREFDYDVASEKGPNRWGELKEEWAACGKGQMQSPIDMSNERVQIISKQEKRLYKPSNATVINRGHDISVRWGGNAGSIFINETEYPLAQTHWHSPSEHTINGRRYDLEMHMVHETTNPNVTNNIVVIGVLYKIGKPNEFLSTLMSNISSMIDMRNEERELEVVDPRDIEISSKRYYRYMGSLTVPPCSEGVIWTINKKVRTVSREQVHLLREAVHDSAERNARPLQLRNRREISLYGPGTGN